MAGGEGRRLGGQDKGLVLWQKKPMIQWVADVANFITNDLVIVCNRNRHQYLAFSKHVISDDEGEAYQGPLAGVRAALRVIKHTHAIVLPCDCPALDTNFLITMMHAVSDSPVMLRRNNHWEPMFSLLPKSCIDTLDAAWLCGERSLWRALMPLKIMALDWSSDDARLSNFNTPDFFQ